MFAGGDFISYVSQSLDGRIHRPWDRKACRFLASRLRKACCHILVGFVAGIAAYLIVDRIGDGIARCLLFSGARLFLGGRGLFPRLLRAHSGTPLE